MLRYLYGDQLNQHPQLRDTMFRDRAEQFSKRLGWAVEVDQDGQERDFYDTLNPLYVVWELAGGDHGGSMRFLPTSGDTMINDHFAHLTGGVTIQSPFIWECTRFCLSPQADRKTSAALVLGAGEVMKNFTLSHFVGVFDNRMERIYCLHGVAPDVIGSSGDAKERISVGLWEMKPEAWKPTLARVGVDAETSAAWFAASVHGVQPVPECA
ncbi:MAG: acyl-homoserine-lactone synthase [Pseudomonadota bacterium]